MEGCSTAGNQNPARKLKLQPQVQHRAQQPDALAVTSQRGSKARDGPEPGGPNEEKLTERGRCATDRGLGSQNVAAITLLCPNDWGTVPQMAVSMGNKEVVGKLKQEQRGLSK